MGHLLEIKNLQTQFVTDGEIVKAVDGVSLHLDEGEIISVVGESGSGKSVTQMSMLQLITSPGKIIGGEVYFQGKDILKYYADGEEMRDIRGGQIGMIFQEPMTSLNPVFTAGFQISENIRMHLKLSAAESKARAIEMMRMVGIPDAESRYSYYPNQFSGGMRQRVMIAMALSVQPKILIADEATTALDVTTQDQIFEMLCDTVKKLNTSLIIVTHNLGIVARYAQRIYVMYAGKIMESGNIKQIFASPEHPYTRGLLKAIPRLNDSKDRILVPLDGQPPNLSKKPEYCVFYDRCAYRKDKCLSVPGPNMKESGEGHFSSCWLTQQEKKEREEFLNGVIRKKAPEKHISKEDILTVSNVSKIFPVYKGVLRRKAGEVKALDEVNFSVRKGETMGIVGESGCGKTTLARCLLRICNPEKGSIMFDGDDITKLEGKRLYQKRSQISMIFQDPFSSLDPRQTAGSIIAEPIRSYKLEKSKADRDKRVDEIFTMVGLDPALKDRLPHEFSGGQRQRLGIGRALASNPKMIICDEPISALDVSIQAQIINLLEELQSKLGLTYLFIAHDLAVVKHISDRILVMYLGNIVEIAPCEELYENTLHPYSQALLAAIPVPDPFVEETREKKRIEGEVPSVSKRLPGCPFSDRCPEVMDICRKEKPTLKYAGNSGEHMVACFLYK